VDLSRQKWITKCTPFPPTSRPRTAPSSGPFETDKLSKRHRLQPFLVYINQVQSSNNKDQRKNFGPKYLTKILTCVKCSKAIRARRKVESEIAISKNAMRARSAPNEAEQSRAESSRGTAIGAKTEPCRIAPFIDCWDTTIPVRTERLGDALTAGTYRLPVNHSPCPLQGVTLLLGRHRRVSARLCRGPPSPKVSPLTTIV